MNKHKDLNQKLEIVQLVSQKDELKQDAAENKMRKNSLHLVCHAQAQSQDAPITTVILEENHLCQLYMIESCMWICIKT